MTANNQLDFPWHETAEDATTAAIHKSGMNMQKVAHELWSHLKMETAYASLRAGLNPNQDRKLVADEHLRIANITQQFDFLYYCAQECHHSKPEPVKPEDERDNLRREFNQSVDRLSTLAERIKRLDAA